MKFIDFLEEKITFIVYQTFLFLLLSMLLKSLEIPWTLILYLDGFLFFFLILFLSFEYVRLYQKNKKIENLCNDLEEKYIHKIKELENGVKVINDSYNANFESMQASLKYLSGFDNRKIAVLGDMFELGKFSEEFHKKVGKEVKENNIDILICLGEKAKYIAESAEENGMKKENIYYFQNREKIVDFIKSIWKENDVYLFKASNGMKFFELADKLLT